VLQNPGGEPAEVTLTLLGGGGEAGTPPSLEVAPGTAVRLDLPSAPAAVLVEAAGGRVVPAQVSLDPQAYAVSVGVPLD